MLFCCCGSILQKWHPDKHKGDTAAAEKFIEINDAYNGKVFCIFGSYASRKADRHY